jgi:phosphonate transport system substrate-binding protein
VRSLLTNLHETADGRAVLLAMETSEISSASDKDYDLVRNYVARFEQEVRPVKGP